MYPGSVVKPSCRLYTKSQTPHTGSTPRHKLSQMNGKHAGNLCGVF